MMLAVKISSVKISSVELGTWQSEPGLVGQAVEVAIKLCLMARDMDMETRVAVFNAIGKILTVSEDIMLQTLSKKALVATKEKNYPGQYTAKVFKIPASAAAFTFVHGLEDEFYQSFSAEFASMVVHRLMDMLNDDSEVVRLQVLQTLHHMAINDHQKLEESHLDLASMIWIIGEYAERIDNADELLESFVETFPDEPPQVQLQLLTTTVKLFLKKPTEGPHQIIQMTVRDWRTCNVEFQSFFVLGEGQKKFSSRRTMASIVKPPSQEMVLRPPSLHR